MATNAGKESEMMSRLADFADEPKRMLSPIKGYEKQPLVSLEQAIQPLLSLVPDIEQMVWIIKENCLQPQDNLSSDESASIMLYTLEWTPHEESFYFILNKTLRSLDRNELLPWFSYLRLFVFALSKLPSTTHRMIYRGIKMDVSDEFPEGKTFIWWAFSSCSSSLNVLQRFLGNSGYRTIFNIECDSARDICRHSFYGRENEILMYPARQFQVVSSLSLENQYRIIHVREIQPRFPLIYIPSITSSNTMEVNGSQTSSTNSTYENKQLRQLIGKYEHGSAVYLSNQNLTDEDMNIVAKEAIINKKCTILDLSYNKITSVGASIIAEGLKNNNTLKMLYLPGNPLYDKGVLPFTKTLALNNCKIDFLDLQSTGITDVGAGYIATLLQTNNTLRSLLLGNNEITDIKVQCLANVLTHQNSTLVSLRVNGNKGVSDLSVDALIEMLKQNQSLQTFIIRNCSLSDKGKDRLQEIVRSRKRFKLEV